MRWVCEGFYGWSTNDRYQGKYLVDRTQGIHWFFVRSIKLSDGSTPVDRVGPGHDFIVNRSQHAQTKQ